MDASYWPNDFRVLAKVACNNIISALNPKYNWSIIFMPKPANVDLKMMKGYSDKRFDRCYICAGVGRWGHRCAGHAAFGYRADIPWSVSPWQLHRSCRQLWCSSRRVKDIPDYGIHRTGMYFLYTCLHRIDVGSRISSDKYLNDTCLHFYWVR